MNAFLSNEFFHLVGWRHPDDDVGNVAILKSILSDRCVKYRDCVPGQSRTSVTVWPNRRLSSGEMFVPTCTCYCDIPIESLGFHARKYGRFGLSFHRDFLIRAGARPVTYIPMRDDDELTIRGTALLDDIQAIYDAFRNQLVEPMRERVGPHRTRTVTKMPDTLDGIVDGLHTILAFRFLAFVKPYNSQLPPTDLHYYYSEREWRITNYMHFLPSDVERVIVSTSEYAAAVANEFSEYRDKSFVLPPDSPSAESANQTA